jgi:AAT family amino acid transporter
MYLVWKLVKRTKIVSYDDMDFETDVYQATEEDLKAAEREKTARGKVENVISRWIF